MILQTLHRRRLLIVKDFVHCVPIFAFFLMGMSQFNSSLVRAAAASLGPAVSDSGTKNCATALGAVNVRTTESIYDRITRHLEKKDELAIFSKAALGMLERAYARIHKDQEYKKYLFELYQNSPNDYWINIIGMELNDAMAFISSISAAQVMIFPLLRTRSIVDPSFENSESYKNLTDSDKILMRTLALPFKIEKIIVRGWPEVETQMRTDAMQMLPRTKVLELTKLARAIPIEIKDCSDCPQEIRFTEATYKHSLFHFAGNMDPVNSLQDALTLSRRNGTSMVLGAISPSDVGNTLAIDNMRYLFGEGRKEKILKARLDSEKESDKEFLAIRARVKLHSSRWITFRLVICKIGECTDNKGNLFYENDVISVIPLWGDGVVDLPGRTKIKKLIEEGNKGLPKEYLRNSYSNYQ